MLRIFALALLLAPPAAAADRTVLKLATTLKSAPVELWLTRADGADGSLVLKLMAKGLGARPQALTLYEGGGGDDGPGGAEVRNLTAKLIDLPMAGKAVRVDFTYRVPGTRDEENDTTLVGVTAKLRKLLQLTTRKSQRRNKLCAVVEEAELRPEGDELDGGLVVEHRLTVNAALGDDDEPIDKRCVPRASERQHFRFNGERYVEAAAPSPSPMPDSEED